MRKYFIDNLRWLCVLLLFPYHLFMIYNSFGENFYVKGASIKATTTFIVLVWPWFMPLLFVIAGASTAYALKKRSLRAYMKERTTKLLVPLLAGILLIVPAQTYFAERFHNGYTGGYFAQYILFFTKPTDLTGYTGGFTPAHLWFILYLFVISLAALPVILLARRLKAKEAFSKTSASIPLPIIICLFILPVLGALVLDIAGKSLGEYFVWFMLGYVLLSRESIQQHLEKYQGTLGGIALTCLAVSLLQWYGVLVLPGRIPDVFSRLYAWVMILACFGLGKKYLDMNNRFTHYMSRSSFSVFLFHQTWIVVAAYYALQITKNIPAQMGLIVLISVPATFATYELCRRT